MFANTSTETTHERWSSVLSKSNCIFVSDINIVYGNGERLYKYGHDLKMIFFYNNRLTTEIANDESYRR